jgi:hypothetical protein
VAAIKSEAVAALDRNPHLTMQIFSRQRCEVADWHQDRIDIDSHIEIAGFHYSVAHALFREQSTPARPRPLEFSTTAMGSDSSAAL